jgi:hypothetical protein
VDKNKAFLCFTFFQSKVSEIFPLFISYFYRTEIFDPTLVPSIDRRFGETNHEHHLQVALHYLVELLEKNERSRQSANSSSKDRRNSRASCGGFVESRKYRKPKVMKVVRAGTSATTGWLEG